MLDDSWHAVTDFSAVYITVVNHKSLAHWKFFILCFLKKFILSPYLSMVVLMLSIRVGGRVGGGGGLELSCQAYVYLPLFALLVSQLLSRGFGTYLSSHGSSLCYRELG